MQEHKAWLKLIKSVSASGDAEEGSLRYIQMRLAAFSQVVMHAVSDEIVKVVRTQMMTKVR